MQQQAQHIRQSSCRETAAELHDTSTKFLQLQVVPDNYPILQKQDVPNSDMVFLCQKRREH